MEIFNHRFYKPLDDKVAVADMGTADTIVCYELPCNARQGWGYKKKDDDPWILPLFLADQKPPIKTSMYGSTRTQVSYFGYPTIVVIGKEEASSVDAIYHNVVSRLERWTAHAPDLYQWEHSLDAEDAITKISAHSTFTPPLESVTEITPEGDVREVEQPVVDLTEEKGMDVDPPAEEPTTTPRPVRAKKDLFDLRLQANHKDTGNLYSSYSQSKWLTWEDRKAEAENYGLSSLLRETDGLYCEFDENMKAYFFGEHANSFEHAKWRVWKEFVHAEYSEGKKASAQKKKKGLTLEDCLEEFVREEQLGEDDLWYCPKCKKHQQATKKFDLWKAPDILVVHLKRFSNSRILRDKIDSLVDFPIEGLDLGDKIGERAVAKRLKEQGIEVEEFKSLELEEPLLYDLFAVDEHIGGLGGGHYRAYSVNHQNGKWYHFDDGYVTEAKATSAIVSTSPPSPRLPRIHRLYPEPQRILALLPPSLDNSARWEDP
jgi:ubiquitin carboxyl-terminal hydrolase 4/11/15